MTPVVRETLHNAVWVAFLVGMVAASLIKCPYWVPMLLYFALITIDRALTAKPERHYDVFYAVAFAGGFAVSGAFGIVPLAVGAPSPDFGSLVCAVVMTLCGWQSVAHVRSAKRKKREERAAAHKSREEA